MKKILLFLLLMVCILPTRAELSFADTKRLAEQGNKLAQYHLGMCYELGRDVTKDYTQAAYWYKKSADQGYSSAQNNIGACYKNGTGVTKDYAQAVYWFRKSANQGEAVAEYNLGVCYEWGQGVAKDYAQAVYWYKKAAEQGLAAAQYNLGLCYYAGKGVGRNAQQAVYWYKKAAEQGNADAQFNLGMCYSMGEGVAKDHTQAAYWYKKSAAQGNINASIALDAFGYNDTKKTTKENLTFTVKGVSFEMVYVEGGTFTMGATSEQGSSVYDSSNPAHLVTLSDYYIGKYEVTQGLWEAVMGSNPSEFKGSTKPVEKVNWSDCNKFINKLNSILSSQLNNMCFALPTEAQWEYAARGGKKSQGYRYAGSNSVEAVSWNSENSGHSSHEVGMKASNELGLYDMSGNIEEWCQDKYGQYSHGSQTNPTGASEGVHRVQRGGSWATYAWSTRVSHRACIEYTYRLNSIGLRLCLIVK
ncbi:MAG: SUMF1/EgtB/PvdO family nonheme iron enzyme [Bacteroidaceae bacterium]|nr:SUMF1/EgtB/PvdO family nonheme iron enzyme [Bacteroidaceae bacterium]